MYNYSPNKLRRGGKRHDGNGIQIGSLDLLPAVPERNSSASFFDSGVNATDSQKVFNLYDTIDNLHLNFDKDCETVDSQILHSQPDGFQAEMEEIEQTMNKMTLPRFKLPDRPLKLTEYR